MTDTEEASIRLLHEGEAPADAVSEGVELTQCDKCERGAMIGFHARDGGIE